MKQIIFFHRIVNSFQFLVSSWQLAVGSFQLAKESEIGNTKHKTHYSLLTIPASRFFLLLLFITFVSKTFGQQIPLDIAVQNRYNEITLDADTSIFTGFRSVNWIEVEPYLNNNRNNIIDSIFSLSKTPGNYAFKNIGSNNWIQ